MILLLTQIWMYVVKRSHSTGSLCPCRFSIQASKRGIRDLTLNPNPETLPKCVGLPDSNFLLNVQNIANWSKHVIIKEHEFQKQRFQSAVWTITSTRPDLSADSTSSLPHYILWPLKHFLDCCVRISVWKRPKPAWSGGREIGWSCRWIKSANAGIPLLDRSFQLTIGCADLKRHWKIKHVKWSCMKESVLSWGHHLRLDPTGVGMAE